METIYVVVAGRYSDYHVVTATSNKELANAVVLSHNSSHSEYDKASVLEFCDAEQRARCVWEVYETVPGVIGKAEVQEYEYEDFDKIGSITDADTYSAVDTPGCLRTVIFADDIQSAVKVAAEKFAQYRAEHIGL